jgi:putative transposase
MGISHILLESGGVYHIYNHAVGGENLFREDENYLFFLGKIESRILPVAEVLAYCLMPNHFHFVIRIREKRELINFWKEKFEKTRSRLQKYFRDSADHDVVDALLVMEFGNLFNSYVQAFNKKYSRRGSLLKESFQRKKPDSDIGLIRLICYVHNNPVNHGFVQRREEWKYSSYNAMLTEGKTHVLRNDVMSLLGGRDNFLYLHDKNQGDELD